MLSYLTKSTFGDPYAWVSTKRLPIFFRTQETPPDFVFTPSCKLLPSFRLCHGRMVHFTT